VGLGVLVNDDNSVLAAGGFILQLLPGASSKQELIDKIEENIKAMKPVSTLIHEGFTPEMIIQEITKGDHELVEYMDLKYACDCSKERFARGLLSLGTQELGEMIKEGKPIETVCHFCQTKYDFSIEELQELSLAAEKGARPKEA
jgi:molecular chaperone Hsp33